MVIYPEDCQRIDTIRFKNDYDICSWNGIYRIE